MSVFSNGGGGTSYNPHLSRLFPMLVLWSMSELDSVRAIELSLPNSELMYKSRVYRHFGPFLFDSSHTCDEAVVMLFRYIIHQKCNNKSSRSTDSSMTTHQFHTAGGMYQ